MRVPSADPKSNRWNPISNRDQRNKGSNQPLPTRANHHIITTNLLIINYLYIIGRFEKLCLVGRLVGWSHFSTSVNFKTHFYFPLSPFWGVRGKTEGRHLTMATLQITLVQSDVSIFFILICLDNVKTVCHLPDHPLAPHGARSRCP